MTRPFYAFIVAEKESKLRIAMSQMGLRSSAYWASWFITCCVTNLVCVLLLCAFGVLIRHEFFLDNAFRTYFTLLFLATFVFTAFAFLCSTVLRTTNGARTLALVWYIASFITVRRRSQLRPPPHLVRPANSLPDTRSPPGRRAPTSQPTVSPTVQFPVLGAAYLASGKDSHRSIIHGLSLVPGLPFFYGMSELIFASSGDSKKGINWPSVDRVQNTDASWDGSETWSVLVDRADWLMVALHPRMKSSWLARVLSGFDWAQVRAEPRVPGLGLLRTDLLRPGLLP